MQFEISDVHDIVHSALRGYTHQAMLSPQDIKELVRGFRLGKGWKKDKNDIFLYLFKPFPSFIIK